jgi:hypothetical protein
MFAIGTSIAVSAVFVLIVDTIGIYPAPAAPSFKTIPAGF